MDNALLSQLLYNMALHDSFDGVGRILISDAKHDIDRDLTADKIISVWRQHYPNHTIKQQSNNILLVYWDGLESTRNNRSSRVPINM